MNTELTRIRGTLILPIFNYAVLIQREFSKYLEPAPYGIYKKGQVLPILTKPEDGNTLTMNGVILEGTVCLESLDIDLLDEKDIFDKYHRVLITKEEIKNKKLVLSNHPTTPVIGLNLIKLLIEAHLNSMLPYYKIKSSNEQAIYAMLKPDAEHVYKDGYLDNYIESLLSQVSEFVYPDRWSIYNISLQSIDIRIDKLVDYRILEWHRKTNSGEWK